MALEELPPLSVARPILLVMEYLFKVIWELIVNI